MKTTEARKRATKKYFDKKEMEGWKKIYLFVPEEIKIKIMNYKYNLMKEYYGIKTK